MAYRSGSNLTNLQLKVNEDFQKGELRFRNPVTLLKLRESGNVMVPDYKMLMGRQDRTVEVKYNARSARSLTTSGATYNHTGAKGDTGTFTPTFTEYSDVAYWSLKQADISLYPLQEQIMAEVKNMIANFAEGLESAATAFLYAGRSGVNNYTRTGTFNTTTDVFELPEADYGTRSAQITKTLMDVNKYQGIPYIVFCDTMAFDKFEKAANQGAGNSENLSFQFNNMTFVKSIDLDASAIAAGYTRGMWIVLPIGMGAALDWIPKQNLEGAETKVNKYGNIINPVDGMVYATHEYDARADENSYNGYKQDVKTEFQMFIDVSFNLAPLSTATETPAQCIALV